MWRGISRAWSVGANEMGEMAVCCVERRRVDSGSGSALWLDSGSKTIENISRFCAFSNL